EEPVQPAPVSPSGNIHAAIHIEINGVSRKSTTVSEVDTLIETYFAVSGQMGGHSEDVRIPEAESRLVRSYIVPDLSVSRFLESESGIREWHIRISQAGRILSAYSNDDTTQYSSMSASIELGGTNSSDSIHTPPIIAELTVTDTRGATRSVWDTLEL